MVVGGRRALAALFAVLVCSCTITPHARGQDASATTQEEVVVNVGGDTYQGADCNCSAECGAQTAEVEEKAKTAGEAAAKLEAEVKSLRDELSSMEGKYSKSEEDRANASRLLAEAEERAQEAEKRVKAAEQSASESSAAAKAATDAALERAELADKKADAAEKEKEEAVAKMEEAKEKLHASHTETLAEVTSQATECHTNLAKSEATCKEAVSNIEKEKEKLLASHTETLSGATSQVSECKSNLAESESNYNEALQKSTSLQDKLDRAKSDKDRETKKLQEKLDELTKEVERQQKQIKSSNDKFFDTRRELFAANDELRKLHRNAGSTYVNLTLIRDDSFKFAGSALQRSSSLMETSKRHAADWWKEFLKWWKPVYAEAKLHAKAAWKKLVELYDEHLSHHVDQAVVAVKDMYKKHGQPIVEEHINPLFKEHINPFYKEHVAPHMATAAEALESIRLSIVSGIEQGTAAILRHIELVQENKENALMDWTVDGLTWTNKNAEWIVSFSCRLLFWYVMFVIGRRFLRMIWKPRASGVVAKNGGSGKAENSGSGKANKKKGRKKGH